MSVVKAIYKAPVVDTFPNEEMGFYRVIIEYNGKIFFGTALISPEDKDFFSERVGYTIALSRARINALKYELRKSKSEFRERYNLYQEATKYGKISPAEVDPTGNFYHGITRYISRISAIKKAIKQEQKNLNNYLLA